MVTILGRSGGVVIVKFAGKKMYDGRVALFQDVEDLALCYDCKCELLRPGEAYIIGRAPDLEELRERLNGEGLL